MHREGHVGAALIAYAPIAFGFSVLGALDATIVGALVVTGLSMVPDVDIKLPFVRHRGPTHTVHFTVAVGVVLGLVGVAVGLSNGLIAAVVLGCLGFLLGSLAVGSHIAVDALTPMGVDPWMNGERISYDVTSAANPVANYALLAGGVGISVAAVGIGLWINGIIG